MAETAAPPTQISPPTREVVTCQNCGRMLVGEFCHGCGQTSAVHRSFLKELTDIFRNIVNLDSRTFRTVLNLFFRPGKLTRDFVYGKRVGFLPPFTLFVASVFFLFTYYSLLVGPTYFAAKHYTKQELLTEAHYDVMQAQETLSLSRQRLQKLSQATKDGQKPSATREVLRVTSEVATDEIRVSQAQQRLARIQALPDSKITATGDPLGISYIYKGQDLLGNGTQDILFEIDAIAASITAETGNAKEPEPVRLARHTVEILFQDNHPATFWDKSAQLISLFAPSGFHVETPWPALNERVNPNLKDPKAFVKKFAASAHSFAILIVPASLPFICLLLAWRRDTKLYDHVVFTLYASAFLVLVFIGFTILAHWIAWADLLDYLFFVCVIHLFFHLKHAYALRYATAFGLTAAFGLIFAPFAILLFFSSVVFLTAI